LLVVACIALLLWGTAPWWAPTTVEVATVLSVGPRLVVVQSLGGARAETIDTSRVSCVRSNGKAFDPATLEPGLYLRVTRQMGRVVRVELPGFG
jgi:hypothetical protein